MQLPWEQELSSGSFPLPYFSCSTHAHPAPSTGPTLPVSPWAAVPVPIHGPFCLPAWLVVFSTAEHCRTVRTLALFGCLQTCALSPQLGPRSCSANCLINVCSPLTFLTATVLPAEGFSPGVSPSPQLKAFKRIPRLQSGGQNEGCPPKPLL